MAEHTVKVADDVGRIVADLAHAMGRTKKQVLREAVLVFADLHAKTVARGLEESSRRASAASGSLEGARVLAEAGGDPLELDLRERIRVLRREIVAVVEQYGAGEVRLIDETTNGPLSEKLRLLVVSDLTGPPWRHVEAAAELRRLLGAPVELIDATRLRLFAPDRLSAISQWAVPL